MVTRRNGRSWSLLLPLLKRLCECEVDRLPWSTSKPTFFWPKLQNYPADPPRRFRKNSCKIVAHSFCKRPYVISHRWLKDCIWRRFIMLPAAPADGSAQPKITRRIRVCTTAPAHIAQGSF